MLNNTETKIKVLYETDVEPPSCPHGPTLLFEKYSLGAEAVPRQFYACSACRDRKDCSFFRWHDDHVKADNQELSLESNLQAASDFTENFRFCKTCNGLLSPQELTSHNALHSLIDLNEVTRPSLHLVKIKNNRKEAQFIFSDSSVNFVKDFIVEYNYTHILCIGTPRIHEEMSVSNSNVESLLLDIDSRYAMFEKNKSRFCQYNMFNHHFFGGKHSVSIYKKFLQSSNNRLLILVDPPFGGLVQVLAHTLRSISLDCRPDISGNEEHVAPTFIFYPYFHEKMINEHLPSFKMADYQVEYMNHRSFRNDTGKKRGSPIRIFTNIDQSMMILPRELGYKFCGHCERYVAKLNAHCLKCNACTSKDGRPYVHCDECGKCRKSTWRHCNDCKICVVGDHDCNDKRKGCFKCGDLSHKMQDCPYKPSSDKKVTKQKGKKQGNFGKRKKSKVHP